MLLRVPEPRLGSCMGVAFQEVLPVSMCGTAMPGFDLHCVARFWTPRRGRSRSGAHACSLMSVVCRANIKVSSTETGAIFGNIVYESTGYAERSVIVLNDIHIDIMDYISPASCPDVQFRSMWAEFEWENKVSGVP